MAKKKLTAAPNALVDEQMLAMPEWVSDRPERLA
jgi:hypothetical protein